MRDPAVVRHFRERADSFYQSVQLLDLDSTYGPAVGLLAVHGGIALTDAVLVAEEGSRSREDDHRLAARALEQLYAARQLNHAGVKHLKELLKRKTDFSYGEEHVRDEEFKWAKMKMEQFFKWVYSTFPELARTEEAGDAKPD